MVLPRRSCTRMAVSMSILLGLGLIAATPSSAQSKGVSGSPRSSQACDSSGKTTGLPAPGTLRVTRAEVAAIESRIAAEQLCITNLSEQYDQATYRLQQVDSALAATKVRLAAAERNVAGTRSQLQTAALNAYMFDEPAVELGSMFSGTTDSSSLQNAYISDALGNISGDLAAMRAAELSLLGTQHQLLSERAKPRPKPHLPSAPRSWRRRRRSNRGDSLCGERKARGSGGRCGGGDSRARRGRGCRRRFRAVKEQDALEAEQAAQVAQSLGDGDQRRQPPTRQPAKQASRPDPHHPIPPGAGPARPR